MYRCIYIYTSRATFPSIKTHHICVPITHLGVGKDVVDEVHLRRDGVDDGDRLELVVGGAGGGRDDRPLSGTHCKNGYQGLSDGKYGLYRAC